jgi:hypothetical protein
LPCWRSLLITITRSDSHIFRVSAISLNASQNASSRLTPKLRAPALTDLTTVADLRGAPSDGEIRLAKASGGAVRRTIDPKDIRAAHIPLRFFECGHCRFQKHNPSMNSRKLCSHGLTPGLFVTPGSKQVAISAHRNPNNLARDRLGRLLRTSPTAVVAPKLRRTSVESLWIGLGLVIAIVPQCGNCSIELFVGHSRIGLLRTGVSTYWPGFPLTRSRMTQAADTPAQGGLLVCHNIGHRKSSTSAQKPSASSPSRFRSLILNMDSAPPITAS